MCNRAAGYILGTTSSPKGPGLQAQVLSCGSWSCPQCRKEKAKKIYARAMNGRIAKSASAAGFRDRYNYKFLTLTCPGREYRESHSPVEAAKEMRDALAHLLDALRKEYGDFEYLRVMEEQPKSGYPHFHLLLVGAAIAPADVHHYITEKWRETYGMGFIKLNTVKGRDRQSPGDVKDAIRYIIKYLFKQPTRFGKLRIWSCGQGSIDPPWKSDTKYDRFIIRWSGIHHQMNGKVIESIVGELTGERIAFLLSALEGSEYRLGPLHWELQAYEQGGDETRWSN